MAKQLFSEAMMKMANIPLDEEMDSMENSEGRNLTPEQQTRSQKMYDDIVEMIKQTGGHLDKVDLFGYSFKELPEGIISVKDLRVRDCDVAHFPESLKTIGHLTCEDAYFFEFPEDENFDISLIHVTPYDDELFEVPSYNNLKELIIVHSNVTSLGKYPKLESLDCNDTPFLEKAMESAEKEGIDVETYIRRKLSLPETCEVFCDFMD